MMPLVSILVPTRDRIRYIDSAVRSAMGQSHIHIEILIHDDGSSDGSATLLQDLAEQDPRIRLSGSSHPQGVAAARNDLISRARGTFICFVDSDDLIHPEKVARQLAYFESNSDVVAVGTNALLMDETGGEVVGHLGFEQGHERLAYMPDFCHASIMYRSWAIKQAWPLRLVFSDGEDVDLLLRVAEFGRVSNIPEDLYFYRQHAAQLSRRQGGGNVIAMASRLLRDSNGSDLLDYDKVGESAAYLKILAERSWFLSRDLERTLDNSDGAPMAAVHVLLHAARRALPWRERWRIALECIAKRPVVTIRLLMRWLGITIRPLGAKLKPFRSQSALESRSAKPRREPSSMGSK